MLYKSNLLTLVTMVDSWYIDEYWFMGPRGRFYSYVYHVIDVRTCDVSWYSSPYKGDSARFS